ncbi:MAG TPA: ATP-binding protein [Chloroflexota bacterium]|jgi:two-component system sensor histidine kinase KdpD
MSWDSPRLKTSWAGWGGYAAALGAVGLVSVLIGLVLGRLPIANISMLYLIAVLAVAVLFGSLPAVVASVAAFLAFDFFFVEPLHTFTVSDPEEWVSLLLFLLTAIVTGQLAAGQRRRAREAEQREHEAVVLYDVVRLVTEPELSQALSDVAERLRRELDLAAVAIQAAESSGPPVHVAVGDDEALRIVRAARAEPARVLGQGRAPTGAARGAPGRWVRIISPTRRRSALEAGERARLHMVPLLVQERRIGALLLVRRPDAGAFGAADDRLLSAVAAQIGVAAERARLRREAMEAEILRRTDELKTALLNAVSHDLRTPLASIIASAGSLLQEDVAWTPDERREFAQAIEEEAQRLNRIVGNLLDLSRLEGGSLRPERAWYDLGALVDDVVGRLRPLTAGHGVVVSVPENLPPIYLDYVEIDQVLSNLIENAVKYTPPGAPIEITVRQDPGAVRVIVTDRGPGIPEAALPRLFDSFYRVDEGGPRPQGQGVGLAVARGLIEAHGGRIWATNRAGGGATFTFTLPLGDASSAEAAAAPHVVEAG